jgi:hypothetical protein
MGEYYDQEHHKRSNNDHGIEPVPEPTAAPAVIDLWAKETSKAHQSESADEIGYDYQVQYAFNEDKVGIILDLEAF